jgi:hypothetical protein
MVIQDAKKLVSFLDHFDPNDAEHLRQIESLVYQFPNFHLTRAYYLKALQQQQSEGFDKALSHTAIATHDRELLYQFIETQTKKAKKSTKKKEHKKTPPQNEPTENTSIEIASPEITPEKEPVISHEKTKETPPENRRFSEWASYLKSKKSTEKQPKIAAKFELIDTFLAKQNKIVPDINAENTVDLSEKSWAAPYELMTETLAKVFVKQKKYNKALEAYQILGLKYPEKNSFFANQIKEIKRLQKLKE